MKYMYYMVGTCSSCSHLLNALSLYFWLEWGTDENITRQHNAPLDLGQANRVLVLACVTNGLSKNNRGVLTQPAGF